MGFDVVRTAHEPQKGFRPKDLVGYLLLGGFCLTGAWFGASSPATGVVSRHPFHLTIARIHITMTMAQQIIPTIQTAAIGHVMAVVASSTPDMALQYPGVDQEAPHGVQAAPGDL